MLWHLCLGRVKSIIWSYWFAHLKEVIHFSDVAS
jgi:hypothetical protein